MHFWNFLTYLISFERMSERNTLSSGICYYAAHRVDKECEGTVTKEMVLRWNDPFAPENTPYQIWTYQKDPDVVIATFFESEFSYQVQINLHCLWPFPGFCKFDSFDVYWHVHCFEHALGYLEHLRAGCQNLSYNSSKTAAKPVLLYTQLTSSKESIPKTFF